jgi:hypothetical protein
MKKGLLLFFLILVVFISKAQTAKKKDVDLVNHLDSVNIGFFVTSLRNIDFVNNSFNADIWVWMRYKNPKYELNHDNALKRQLPDCLEWIDDITEQTNEKNSVDIDDEDAQMLWATFKVNRKFRKKWSLGSYPFDIQQIDIKLESDYFDSDKLVLTTDKASIDSKFIANETEWTPIIDKKHSFKSYLSTYETSFGDPDENNNSKPSVYSGVSSVSRCSD